MKISQTFKGKLIGSIISAKARISWTVQMKKWSDSEQTENMHLVNKISLKTIFS